MLPPSDILNKLIFSSLFFFITLFEVNGQNSTSDSLVAWYENYEMKDKFYAGEYETGCALLDKHLTNNLLLNKIGYLYGGKCCFRLNAANTVLKMFASEKIHKYGDLCRLDWGDTVETDSIFINFCLDNQQTTYYNLRENVTNKNLSDTLVQFLIDDQGSRLHHSLRTNLDAKGYAHLNFSPDTIWSHNKRVLFIKNYLTKHHKLPSEEMVGTYGKKGLNLVMIHSKLEDLEYFKQYVSNTSSTFAYIQDKISVAKNEPQKFGTQSAYCEIKKKNLLYMTENCDLIDTHRMRANMGPINRYLKSIDVDAPCEVCE